MLHKTRTSAFLLAWILLLQVFLPLTAPPSLAADLPSLSKEVEAELEDGREEISVLLLLKEEADLDEARRQASAGRKRELAERVAVIDALEEVADRTQKDILNYLKEQEKAGKVLSFDRFYILNAIAVTAKPEVIRALSGFSEIAQIVLDEKLSMEDPDILPPMPTLMSDSQPEPDRESIEWNIEKVDADRVWKEQKVDGTGIVIGVLDSGVYWEHPALKRKFRAYNETTGQLEDVKYSWYDPYENSPLPTDNPNHPHGTHVTGIILGSEVNGENNIGVAPGATWIAARGITPDGNSSNTLKAAEWFLAPGGDPAMAPDIVNNSWGTYVLKSPWFTKAIESWRAANIIPVFAAGNRFSGEPKPRPGSIVDPANSLDVITVGAINKANELADFSRRGPSNLDPSGEKIKPEIVAPGENIRSAYRDGRYVGNWNGTSLAAPHVSGVIAMMLQVNPTLTFDQIRDILEKSAKPLSDYENPGNPNMGFGYGLLDAYTAVSMAMGEPVREVHGRVYREGLDTQAPSVSPQFPEVLFPKEDLHVLVDVQDQTPIQEVLLRVRPSVGTTAGAWEEVPLKRMRGTDLNGSYEGVWEEKEGMTQVEVQILVRDSQGNEKKTDLKTIPVQTSLKVQKGYLENFELGAHGWTLEGAYRVGQGGTNNNISPKQGRGMLYTSYNEGNGGGIAIAYSPILDLTGAQNPKLRYYEALDKRSAQRANIQVSIKTVGEDHWSELYSISESEADNYRNWQERVLDLSPYKEKEAIQLKFEYNTGGLEYMIYAIDQFQVLDSEIMPSVQPTTLTGAVIPTKAKIEIPELGIETWTREDGSFTIRYVPKDLKQLSLLATTDDQIASETLNLEEERQEKDLLLKDKGRGSVTLHVTGKSGEVKVKNLLTGEIKTLAGPSVTFDNLKQGLQEFAAFGPEIKYQTVEVPLNGTSTETNLALEKIEFIPAPNGKTEEELKADTWKDDVSQLQNFTFSQGRYGVAVKIQPQAFARYTSLKFRIANPGHVEVGVIQRTKSGSFVEVGKPKKHRVTQEDVNIGWKVIDIRDMNYQSEDPLYFYVTSQEDAQPFVFVVYRNEEDLSDAYFYNDGQLIAANSGYLTGMPVLRVKAEYVERDPSFETKRNLEILPLPDYTAVQGQDFKLPNTVTVLTNKNSYRQADIKWSAYSTKEIGTFPVTGQVEGLGSIQINLKIIGEEILSVDSLDPIQINQGEDIQLPDEVTVTLKGGIKKKKPIHWETKLPDSKVPGKYTIEGRLDHFDGKVIQELEIVKVEPVLEIKRVLDELEPVHVVLGQMIEIPETVRVEMTDGSVQNIQIKWEADSGEIILFNERLNYRPQALGTFQLAGYLGDYGVKIHLTVHVLEEKLEKKNGLVEEDGNSYFYIDDVKQHGWVSRDGWTRFFRAGSGTMCTGWQYIDGHWYYFRKSGTRVESRWEWLDGNWKFFNSKGESMDQFWEEKGKIWLSQAGPNTVYARGWKTVAGFTYFFRIQSGTRVTGWQYIDGYWRFFRENSGTQVTGWQYIDGNWFFFRSSGTRADGWQYIGGNWYYLNGSEGRVNYNKWIGGTLYTFNARGVCTNR